MELLCRGASTLVAALVGAIPDGLQINHRDLNKQNNRPITSEVVTGSENIAHSYAHGRTEPWALDDHRPRLAREANQDR